MKIIDNIAGEMLEILSRHSAIRNAEQRVKCYDDPHITMTINRYTITIDYKDNDNI